MSEHVNFLERDLFSLSYKKLALMGAALALIFLGILGVQTLQMKTREGKISAILQEVYSLRSQKEAILAAVESQADKSGGAETSLKTIFEKRPRWSPILQELARIMPADLWLVSFKAYPGAAGPNQKNVLLTGASERAKSIFLFLEALKRAEYFENPVLKESKQEAREKGRTYTFTIESRVREGSAYGD